MRTSPLCTLAPGILAKLLLVSAMVLGTAAQAAEQPKPKLVLQLTVDQLRGDLLPKYQHRFGQGGFRLLMEKGVYFGNAHYATANTLTCAGHAVLVTGADVGEHGIIGNDWYERDIGRTVYCVDDDRYPPVGDSPRESAGISPVRLTSSTIGDEIVVASGGRSRAFAVSGKDRSAVMPAGRLGKAFWFSPSGGMETSRYYYETLPDWVKEWNDKGLIKRYVGQSWTLSHPIESYLNYKGAANPHATPKQNMGASFPHALAKEYSKAFVSGLQFTPFFDDITGDFARELIVKENLGKNGVTDYLSVSFSATDYIGHAYGPNSIESEENLIRLDATIAQLLSVVDKTIGLRNVVIALSADHGVDDIPEERKAAGFDSERFGDQKMREKLNAALRARLNISEDLVDVLLPPNIYFNQTALAASKVERKVAEDALAAEMRAEPGVAYVFTRSDLMAGRIGKTPILDSVQRAFHPKRSGDVIAIQRQMQYFDDTPFDYAATHGTPYSYDTFVPVVVYAPWVKGMWSFEPVGPDQIAPTIAAILKIRPPSGCSCGPPLPHVLPR
jgi:predicted AlkP superfamily pyrophosphatase or phosphodiesterase